GFRVGLVPGVEGVDVVGVAAVEEPCEGKGGVRVCARQGSRFQRRPNKRLLSKAQKVNADRLQEAANRPGPALGELSFTLFSEQMRHGKDRSRESRVTKFPARP